MTKTNEDNSDLNDALKEAKREVNTTLRELLKKSQLYEKTCCEKTWLRKNLDRAQNELNQIKSENNNMTKEISLVYDQLFNAQELLEKVFFEKKKLLQSVEDKENELKKLSRDIEKEATKNTLINERYQQATLINKELNNLLETTYLAIQSSKNKKTKSASTKSASNSAFLDQVSLIQQSIYFDEKWYLIHNPDVALSDIPAAEHYLLYGGFEGRAPNKNFSSSAYLENNPDVNEAKINPLIHYLEYGLGEGRKI